MCQTPGDITKPPSNAARADQEQRIRDAVDASEAAPDPSTRYTIVVPTAADSRLALKRVKRDRPLVSAVRDSVEAPKRP